ncbi:MAG TPA: peptidyl-prolyl cis-trans isomerase [Solirubrobacteraceae bacterium]|nr:peptidyl-prolyl cis-trans isomerase [Solirubrobacteraceae bacterium]
MALGAFFVCLILVSACGSGVPGNSVADVAGNPITLRAFDHWLYVAAKSQASQNPGAPVIVPNDPPSFASCIAQVRKDVPSLAKTPDKQIKADCKQLFTSYSSQVMDFLIKAYWYQAEAAREHITVTSKQVMKAFTTAKDQQFPTASQFNSFLSQTGQTLQDILFRFRINALFQKLLAKHSSKVTPQTVAAYYRAHLSQFGTPQTRDLRIILTRTQSQALAAKKALQSHQSWQVVAKKYSTDPTTKDSGGLLVNVRKGQEDHALDTAAFSASQNVLLGPVKGQFGYYVFEVTKITPAKQQTLAQATPLIEQTLKSQEQTTSQSSVDKLVRTHWLSQTSCRSPYAMADCTGYKPPPTPTTPTAPSGASTSAAPPTTTSSSSSR